MQSLRKKKEPCLEGPFRDELLGVLYEEKVETPWGMDCRYWFWDYDKELSEVYATDSTDWNLYGFPYSMDGDHVVIDFGSKKRMKIAVVPFDEGNAGPQLNEMFSAIIDKAMSFKEAELESKFSAEKVELEGKYNQAESTITQMNAELSELRQFKQQAVDEARAADEAAVFEQFQDLNGIEAFEKLRENCAELSIEEIEDKCFAIRGRNASVHTFSNQKTKLPRQPCYKDWLR